MKLIGKDRKSVQHIIHATFPNYKGNKVFLQPSEQAPKKLMSYWDEGSKTDYAFYNLDTKETIAVHTNHPMYESKHPNELRELPTHVVLVSHRVSCGKIVGVTLYGNVSGLLPLYHAA